jgi:hypothetical protein
MIIPTAPPPPRRFNPYVALLLGLATVIALVPSLLPRREQARPAVPLEKRAWQMPELVGRTQSELIGRFGTPLSTKDYSLLEGSFAGPDIGLKHYYLLKNPGYAARLKDAPKAWTFPQYTTIRELIWKLPDSYLTVWLHEPRTEASLEKDTIDLTLPSTAPGEWVALDDYRIGQDLLAKPLAAHN